MAGYRRTHDYPHGRPFPLLLVRLGVVVLMLAWVFFVPSHWLRGAEIVGVLLAIAFIDSRLHKHYENTGQAVRVARPRIVVKFASGLPTAMFAARCSFFVVAAMMTLFGVVPMADSTAQRGIIGCVFALIAVAVVNVALERYYVKTGSAQEVDVSRAEPRS